jgi:translation initiation factor IF-2
MIGSGQGRARGGAPSGPRRRPLTRNCTARRAACPAGVPPPPCIPCAWPRRPCPGPNPLAIPSAARARPAPGLTRVTKSEYSTSRGAARALAAAYTRSAEKISALSAPMRKTRRYAPARASARSPTRARSHCSSAGGRRPPPGSLPVPPPLAGPGGGNGTWRGSPGSAAAAGGAGPRRRGAGGGGAARGAGRAALAAGPRRGSGRRGAPARANPGPLQCRDSCCIAAGAGRPGRGGGSGDQMGGGGAGSGEAGPRDGQLKPPALSRACPHPPTWGGAGGTLGARCVWGAARPSEALKHPAARPRVGRLPACSCRRRCSDRRAGAGVGAPRVAGGRGGGGGAAGGGLPDRRSPNLAPPATASACSTKLGVCGGRGASLRYYKRVQVLVCPWLVSPRRKPGADRGVHPPGGGRTARSRGGGLGAGDWGAGARTNGAGDGARAAVRGRGGAGGCCTHC